MKTSRRRGLVLEGGGAKGAFQFGVLLAFHEAGLKFDAVSGTSVGALNGFLWSTGNLELGKELWSALHRNKVFRTRVSAVLFPLAAFLWLFDQYARGRHVADVPALLRRAFALIERLPFVMFGMVMAMVAYGIFGTAGAIVIVLIVLVNAFSTERITEDLFYYYLILVLAVNAFVAWILLHDEAARQYAWSWIAPVAICSLPYYLRFLAFVFARLNISLFDPRPLAELVDRAARDRVTLPIFATITDAITYFDPDTITYESFSTPRGKVAGYRPLPQTIHYPRYIRVDQLDAEQRRELLLASAALPPAIVPTRSVGEFRTVIDGGLADNVPWKPLVVDYPCDELVIVGCNPVTDWDDPERRAECTTHERQRRVIAEDVRLPSLYQSAKPDPVVNSPPEVIPARDLDHWPERVVIVAPPEPLGTFFSATINFDQTRGRELVQAGYEAGRAATSRIVGSR